MKLGTATTLLEFLFLTLWPDVFAEYLWRRHPEKKCSLSLQLLRLAQETMTIRWKTVFKIQRASHKQRNREIILNHTAQKQKCPKKELELLTPHLQSIHSSCGHCSHETLVRAPRRKGAKPLIIKLARDFVCPSCQEIQNQRPHPVASLEAIPPTWQSIQIDQAEWSHPSDNLKYKFSVIIDEGCHLKVAKMLYHKTNNDPHRNSVWTELRDFYLEQWVCYVGKPKRVRVDSEGSWMSEAAAEFFGKESVMLEPIPGQAHWQTGLVEEAIRGLNATMTATALEHPDMGAHECLARAVAASNAREDVRGYSPLQHALGRAPDLDGRFYTPECEALPTVQAELVDETYGNNIKRMQDSEVNFLRWT